MALSMKLDFSDKIICSFFLEIALLIKSASLKEYDATNLKICIICS